MPTITINQELQSLIPPLAPEEYRQLEQNILQDGCHDALVIWQEEQTLLDGHNRYAICERHGLPYAITEISLPDLERAKAWMIANQLGRRNLTPEQMSYFRGEKYNLLKRQGKMTDVTSRHYGEKCTNTAAVLAAAHKVGERTIERDGAFARAVETIAAVVGPDARQLLLARTERLPRQVVQQLAVLTETDPDKAKEVLVAAFEAETPQAAAALIKGATQCGICHKPLTNPMSMQRGIGPVCACKRPVVDGGSNGTSHPRPVPAPPSEPASAERDVQTLLRTTADYLEALHAGLNEGAFAETFDQYAPLWDAVHDGCAHMLDMLDGEPDESDEGARVTILAPSAPVHAPAVPTTGRSSDYGALPAKVRAAMQGHRTKGITAGALAAELGAPAKQVWAVLDRLVKQGAAKKKGISYRWVAEEAAQ